MYSLDYVATDRKKPQNYRESCGQRTDTEEQAHAKGSGRKRHRSTAAGANLRIPTKEIFSFE